MNAIYTEYDCTIKAYVVSVPDEVSLSALEAWGTDFIRTLNEQSGGKSGLLLDTNTHNFESIDCLRWLKNFLTLEHSVKSSINRVAFVQSAQYRKEEVVSDVEAYFRAVQDARQWLSPIRRQDK